MAKVCIDTEFRPGTCKWCGEEGEVYADNGYCEDCDSDIVHCSICDEDQHCHDPCRHVFQDRWFEWAGSGVGKPDDRIRKSFLDLVDGMPLGFAPDLREAIASGRFHTWSIMPMIGGGGLLELNGMPSHGERLMVLAWGDALLELGESSEAEEFHDGYYWLASLYDDHTPDANDLTIRWLDERSAARPRRDQWLSMSAG